MLLMRLAVLNKTGKVAIHILIMVDVDIFVLMFKVCLDLSKALKLLFKFRWILLPLSRWFYYRFFT